MMSGHGVNGRADSRPRGLAVTAAIVAAALTLAACPGGSSGGPGMASANSSRRSGSPSPDPGGSTDQQSMVAFSRCMRTHGVSRFPDPLPGTGGSLPKLDLARLGVSTSGFRAANRSCQQWVPGATSTSIVGLEQCESSAVCLPAETRRLLNAGLRVARCMRAQGVPNWPDPVADSLGRVAFAISISRDGFDPNSPQLSSRENACATGGVDVGWAVSP